MIPLLHFLLVAKWPVLWLVLLLVLPMVGLANPLPVVSLAQALNPDGALRAGPVNCLLGQTRPNSAPRQRSLAITGFGLGLRL